MTECHREFLRGHQIRAKVLLPLFCKGRLWGLLNVAESQTTRDWQVDEIDLLKSLVTQLEIAIQQASTLEQLRLELLERQKAETILQIKNDLLARVAAQENLTDILNHICYTIEKLMQGALCSILLLDSNNQLRELAAPSIPELYRRQVDGVKAGEGVGSCGTAVSRREKVIVSDIANDPLWQEFKDIALESDLRACWSSPIVGNDQSILGTFGIYYYEVHSPSTEDIALVDDFIPVIMLAIQRHQNEIALRKTTQRLEEAQRLAHLGNWEVDLQQNNFYWSEEVFRILEIDPHQNKASYQAFIDLVHPDDQVHVDEAYRNHLTSHSPYTLVHRLQMPDGRIKYVLEAWEPAYSTDEIPTISRGTIQDITQQREAELRRDRAEVSLRQVIEGTAAVTGEAFFPALVQHIAEALGVRYVSVDHAKPDGFHVLAFFGDGKFCLPKFLPYEAVPCCYQSLQIGCYCHPTGIQSLYPENTLFTKLQVDSYLGVRLQNAAGEPIGNLCILHDAPLADPEWSQNLLTIFAARAGAELERYLTAQALETLNVELEQRVTQRTAALAEREARYRGLMECAADAILLADLQGNILEANQRAELLLGYPLAELTTLHTRNLHPPEELPRVSAHFAEITLKQRSQLLNVTCCRRDGSTVSVDIMAAIISIDGKIFVQGIFRDITDRLQIETALRESQQFLQTILDTVPLAVFWKDRDSNYLGANQLFLHDAELSSVSELVGKNDFDLPWRNTEAEEYRAVDYAVINSGEAKLNIIETQHLKDGSKSWLETNKLPLRNLKGEIVGILCTYQDITERKNAETILYRQLAAIEAAVDGIVILEDGCFVYLNSSQVKLFGYENAEELMAKSWRVLYDPEQLERFDQEIAPALAAQRSWQGEVTATCKDGTTFSQRLSLTYVTDNLLVGVCQDISDLKAAESELRRTNAELERATRLKDEFLATMSHELRTPLNAILGMTEGLQEGIFGSINERQLESLGTIESSATHLLSLINDILDVSKIQSGKVSLDYSKVSVEQLCYSSLAFIKQQACGKGINLITKLSPHLPDLFIDEVRMKQVLLNLLTNAVKFTLEGGTITLTASLLPSKSPNSEISYLRIAVSDTGIGISSENVPKLFQPFVQIDSALNRKYSGTGLGLALVKKIVELHDGRVGLISELGIGSCFTIDLPCKAQISADAPSEDLAIAHEAGHYDTLESSPNKVPLVLLAEDNPANVVTIASYLEAKGYNLVCAINGQEAIDLAISHRPDVILMDVQMPHIDGLEAMRRIRQIDGLRHIPIIALTALAMKGDQDRCLAAGANYYLSKPVKLKQLDSCIKELLTDRSL